MRTCVLVFAFLQLLSLCSANEKWHRIPAVSDLDSQLFAGRWHLQKLSTSQRSDAFLLDRECTTLDFTPQERGAFAERQAGVKEGATAVDFEYRALEPQQPGRYLVSGGAENRLHFNYVTAVGEQMEPSWWDWVQFWRPAPPRPYSWAVLVDPVIPAVYVLSRDPQGPLGPRRAALEHHLSGLVQPFVEAGLEYGTLSDVKQGPKCIYVDPIPPPAPKPEPAPSPAPSPPPAPKSEPVVKVGVGLFVVRDGKILIGKRKGAHGAGKIQIPGGHFEFNETPIECGLREAEEETGLTITGKAKLGPYTNDRMRDNKKHYVSLAVVVESPESDGEPRVTEPEFNEFWQWVSWAEVRDRKFGPLFAPIEHLIELGFDPVQFLQDESKTDHGYNGDLGWNDGGNGGGDAAFLMHQ